MVPIVLEERGSGFRVSLAGVPEVWAEGSTPDEAVAAFRGVFSHRVEDCRSAFRHGGEKTPGIYWVDGPHRSFCEPIWPPRPYDPVAAEIAREMVAEIYRERDAEKLREFPE